MSNNTTKNTESSKPTYQEKYRYWFKENLKKYNDIDKTVRKILKEEGKIDEEFEYKLSKIPLEDIVALKFELLYESMNGKIFGIPLWKHAGEIVRTGLLKFAVAITDSKSEAASLLGLWRERFYKHLQKYGIEEFFEDY